MSIYTRMSDAHGGRHRGRDEDEEEQNQMAILLGRENDKLYKILCNYLSLAQFEMARTVLDQLFVLSPERVVRVLRSLALTPVPQKWLFSEQIPTGAHLAWLAYMEYRYLHKTVSKDQVAEEWQAIKNTYTKTNINPLGFLGHGRYEITILDASGLKVFDREDYVPGHPLGFYVGMTVEGKEFSTQDDNDLHTPKWNITFSKDLYFADSKIELVVYAKRQLRDPEDPDEPFEDEPIGRCFLPLHQLRGKEEYHIRIPLEAPEMPDTPAVANPYEMSTKRGQGLSQVAKPKYGKLRVRFRWQNLGVKPGEFAPQLVQSLETDLILAGGVFTGRKAYHAARKGDELARAQMYPSTGLLSGKGEEVLISGESMESSNPILSEESVEIVREYAQLLLKSYEATNPLAKLALKGTTPEDYLFQQSEDIFPELRDLMRAVPAACHALCAKLLYLQKNSPLAARFNFQYMVGPTKFESLYAQSIAEMLLRKEYRRAADCLYHFTHNIAPAGGKNSKLTDGILNAFISYIHDTEERPEKLERTLDNLLIESNIVELGIPDMTEHPIDEDLELAQFSNEHIVRTHQMAALRQTQLYQALLGTPREYVLGRFCSLEDQFLHGTTEQKRDIPSCFFALDRALNTIDKIAITEESDENKDGIKTAAGLDEQRKQSLVTFFSEYYTYIRITNQHMFQYVVRKALGFCRGRNWKDANIVLRPFSELRPLVLLLSWDDFGDDFYGREELITNIWRQRPSFPAGLCKEPRLIEWCNRLDFNVRLINDVLDFVDGYGNMKKLDAQSARNKNDKAIRLLDTLRLHSILYAFRDLLPSMSPTVLVKTFNDPPHADRGQECDHDSHVVRSYYAIRGIMGLMLGDLKDAWIEDPWKFSAERKDVDEDSDDEDTKREEEKKAKSAAEEETTEQDAKHNQDGDGDGDKTKTPTTEETADNQESVLEACADHVIHMTKAEFQVTTLEKIFCLIFLQEEDLMTEEQKINYRATQAQKMLEARKKREEDMAALKKDEDTDMLDREESMSRASSVDSDKADLRGMQEMKDRESPMVVTKVETLEVLLVFLRQTIDKVGKVMHQRHLVNPSPHDTTNSSRLDALRLHIDETLWRLGVLRDRGVTPTVKLLSAPMESIDTIFLKITKDSGSKKGPFARPNHLGNQVVAERWKQLCALVRDRARKKKKDIVNGVIDFIVNYYNDPKALAVGDDASTTAGIMQGFFFAMDVAVVFNHLLTPKAVTSLVDYAISFLQQTRAVHVTPEAVSMYNFYMAFARHMKNHSRTRFDVGDAYDISKVQNGPRDPQELNRLLLWVNAYRMSNRIKSSVKGELLLDGGWLTSTTGRQEDEVSARSYPPYTQSYIDYIKQMGIDGISDPFTNATYEAIRKRAEEKGVRHRSADRPGPWESQKVLSYLTNIAKEAQEEHKRQIQSRTYDALPEDKEKEIAERLERVAKRLTVLGKSLLPSLAALRASMRYSPPEEIKELTKVAREQSKFLPSFSRWVEWRCEVWENAVHLLERQDGTTADMDEEVRALLSQEDVAGDQQAYLKLVTAYLDQDALSVGQKRMALRLCDLVVNGEGDESGKSEALVQALLLSIIDDIELTDEGLRSRCILRLKDTVWAAQMAIKYVDNWENADTCLAVLLKCLSDLQPTHTLRPAIAFKYNLILLWQEMATKFGEEDVQRFISRRSVLRGTLTRSEERAIVHMFGTWQGFELECQADMAMVLSTLLDAKRITCAQKLFELYKKGKTLQGETIAFHLTPEQESLLEDRIEAAVIAQLLSPDPSTGKVRASTKDRITAMRMINELKEEKKFRILRFMTDVIHDAQSRFVVVEYLARHVDHHELAAKIAREGDADARDDEEYTLGAVDDTLMEMRQRLTEVTRIIEEYDEKDLNANQMEERDYVEKQAEEIVQSIEDHRAFLRSKMLSRLSPTVRAEKQKEWKRRQQARRIKKPLKFTKEQKNWLSVVETATKMIVCVPFRERFEYEQFHNNPRGSKIQEATKAMRYFRHYDGSEIDKDGKVVSTSSADERKQLADGFDPFVFVLRFAEEVLALQHKNLGKDVGFAVFDMCLEAGKALHVVDACLNAVNGLSSLLGYHAHALFVVHLMKNTLTYFKAKLENLSEVKQDPDLIDRYADYRQKVFSQQELRQIDGLEPLPRSKQPEPLPLLYSLRRVHFSLDDMCDPTRARKLRERLIARDKVGLARRVWEECEGRDLEDFNKEIGPKLASAKALAESFDALPNV